MIVLILKSHEVESTETNGDATLARNESAASTVRQTARTGIMPTSCGLVTALEQCKRGGTPRGATGAMLNLPQQVPLSSAAVL